MPSNQRDPEEPEFKVTDRRASQMPVTLTGNNQPNLLAASNAPSSMQQPLRIISAWPNECPLPPELAEPLSDRFCFMLMGGRPQIISINTVQTTFSFNLNEKVELRHAAFQYAPRGDGPREWVMNTVNFEFKTGVPVEQFNNQPSVLVVAAIPDGEYESKRSQNHKVVGIYGINQGVTAVAQDIETIGRMLWMESYDAPARKFLGAALARKGDRIFRTRDRDPFAQAQTYLRNLITYMDDYGILYDYGQIVLDRYARFSPQALRQQRNNGRL